MTRITKNLPANGDYFLTCNLLAFLSSLSFQTWENKENFQTGIHNNSMKSKLEILLFVFSLYFVSLQGKIICDKVFLYEYVISHSHPQGCISHSTCIAFWIIRKENQTANHCSPDYKQLGHHYTFVILLIWNLSMQEKAHQVQKRPRTSALNKSMSSQHIAASLRHSFKKLKTSFSQSLHFFVCLSLFF